MGFFIMIFAFLTLPISTTKKGDPAESLKKRTYSCVFNKGYVYCGSTYGVNVYQKINNPPFLKYMKSVLIPDSTSSVKVYKNYLIASASNAGVYVFEILKNGDLKKLYNVKFNFAVCDVEVLKDTLFIASGTMGVHFFKFSPKGLLTLHNSIKDHFSPKDSSKNAIKINGYVRHVLPLNDKHFVVAQGFSGFTLYDFKTHKPVKHFKTGGDVRYFSFLEDKGLLAVANGYKGIIVYKYDGDNLKKIAESPTIDMAHGVFIGQFKNKKGEVKTKIFVADGDGGTLEFELNDKKLIKKEVIKKKGSANKVCGFDNFIIMANDYFGPFVEEVK